MPVRIAPRSNGHESQGPDSCEPERKALNSLEPFMLGCIDHVVPVFPSHSLFFFVDARVQLSSSAGPLLRDNRVLFFSAIVSLPVLYTYQSPLWPTMEKDTIEGQSKYG